MARQGKKSSRAVRILRRWWRRCKGDAEITNSDLPLALLVIMEGPCPPDSFISNGNSFSPDRVMGCDLRAAGHFHDYGYSVCKDEKERKEIDYIFFRNLRKSNLAPKAARTFFLRVRPWGALACEYGGDLSARPRGWAWLKLFFTRYGEW